MADDLKRGPSDDLLDPVSEKPQNTQPRPDLELQDTLPEEYESWIADMLVDLECNEVSDQSQGSEPQNTQPRPDLELQDTLPEEYESWIADMIVDLEGNEVSDQSQGSEPQNTQPRPDLELEDTLPEEYESWIADMIFDWEGNEVSDQSRGSEPQNTQPRPDLELQDILPEEYEWRICDITSDREANEVCSFVKKYYLQCEYSPIEFEYSMEFLRWSLCPPGFKKNWHIGVQDKSTKQLVAFIAAVPVNIRLNKQDVVMAEVKFLYTLRKPKSLGLQPLLMKEMVRIVSTLTVHVAYAATDDFPPMPLATCQCWIRPLNVEKLIDLNFIQLGEGKTVETELELYSLPTSCPTHGLRKMKVQDIFPVAALLRSHLGRFAVAPRFDEIEVGYWFLPHKNLVETYVVEENYDITHFISFYFLPFSTIGVKDSTINTACSLYNVSTKAQPSELLMDALVLAKSHGSDIFKALDIMDNNVPLLEGLKFCSGRKHYYYLHDETQSEELKPSQVGFVMT